MDTDKKNYIRAGLSETLLSVSIRFHLWAKSFLLADAKA